MAESFFDPGTMVAALINFNLIKFCWFLIFGDSIPFDVSLVILNMVTWSLGERWIYDLVYAIVSIPLVLLCVRTCRNARKLYKKVKRNN